MNRILINVLGTILFVALMLLLGLKTTKSLEEPVPEEKSCYEWDELQEYAGKTTDYIIDSLGNPIGDRCALITGTGTFGPRMTLYKFLNSPQDTIYFKELLWEQDGYDFYIWFKQKDSLWLSVDGVKYDPNRVQF